MSIAIVALVRGYEDKNKYKDLFLRNESIYRHISSKLSEKIDFILFHEEILALVIKNTSRK